VTAGVASSNLQWLLAVGSVAIGSAARVSGDVLVENIAADVATERGVAAAVQIGSASPTRTPATTSAAISLSPATAEAQVFANRVTGAPEANNNSSPLDVVANTVGGMLPCRNNTTQTMGGNNTANQTTGRCN